MKHGVKKRFTCQECGGRGEIVDDVIDGYSIFVHCGFCDGTGDITAERRGIWLNYKKQVKAEKLNRTHNE